MFLTLWWTNILGKLKDRLLESLYHELHAARSNYIEATLQNRPYTIKDTMKTMFRDWFASIDILSGLVHGHGNLMEEFRQKTFLFYEDYFSHFLENRSFSQYVELACALLHFERENTLEFYVGLKPERMQDTLFKAIVRPHIQYLYNEFPNLFILSWTVSGHLSRSASAELSNFKSMDISNYASDNLSVNASGNPSSCSLMQPSGQNEHDAASTGPVNLCQNAFFLLLMEGEKAIELIKRSYEDFVVQIGTSHVQTVHSNHPEPLEFVRQVLNLFFALSEHGQLIFPKQCFHYSCLLKAFKSVLSQFGPFCGLFIQNIDQTLRTFSRDFDEDHRVAFVNQCGLLFKCIEDKEHFRHLYEGLLADRLVTNKSLSMGTEVALSEEFKKQCGPDFTMKLDKMLSDIQQSQIEMTEYRKGTNGMSKFNVILCSMGSWPFEVSQVVTVIQALILWSLTCVNL